jgi:CheY-like chemotaxis protein
MGYDKVLIADDDPTTRCVMAEAVEEMGLAAIECSNGRTAWEILEDNASVRLLISDILMPELDGRTLVRILRGNRRFERLPVIMISAVIKLAELEDILELGGVEFLKKPFSVLGLQRLIKQMTAPNVTLKE